MDYTMLLKKLIEQKNAPGIPLTQKLQAENLELVLELVNLRMTSRIHEALTPEQSQEFFRVADASDKDGKNIDAWLEAHLPRHQEWVEEIFSEILNENILPGYHNNEESQEKPNNTL